MRDTFTDRRAFRGAIYPCRGCRLRLVEFGWDDVGGSESVTYRATAEAMRRLIAEGAWEMVTGRYRSYAG